MRYHKFIKIATQAIFFLFCLIVVIYEAVNCIQKYISKPTATEITVESTASLPAALFPKITLCPERQDIFERKNYLNSTHLKLCGIE